MPKCGFKKVSIFVKSAIEDVWYDSKHSLWSENQIKKYKIS